MPEGYTPRGFAAYVSITDDHGARVDVTESSAATIEGEDRGPWVWIMVRGGAIKDNDGAAHLGPSQARAVRDALTEWIDSLD